MIIFFTLLSVLNLSYAQSFDWQSHRGARGLYPENTINAMKEALKYPAVTTLEMDVVISKDGEVVVGHEPWMNEDICLDPKGKTLKGREFNIYKMNYKEIAKFDCGSRPYPRFPEQKKVVEHRPKLSELLREVEKELKKRHKENMKYSIEIKSLPEDEKAGFQPDVKTFSDKVVSVIRRYLSNDRFMLQSFDWRVLRYLHQKYPEIPLVALIENHYRHQDILPTLGFMPAAFSPDYTLMSKEDIIFFKKNGVKIIPWTVNTTEEMKKLKDLGVDGIITDYPNRIP